MMSVSVFSQEIPVENKDTICISLSRMDSINMVYIQRKHLLRKVNDLELASIKADSLFKSYENLVELYKQKESNFSVLTGYYQKDIQDLKLVIDNKNTVISNKDIIIKGKKRKRIWDILMGIGLGSLITTTLVLAN